MSTEIYFCFFHVLTNTFNELKNIAGKQYQNTKKRKQYPNILETEAHRSG